MAVVPNVFREGERAGFQGEKMNRRSFLKSLAGTVALVAAAKVGLGNIASSEIVPRAQVIVRNQTFTEPLVIDDPYADYLIKDCEFTIPGNGCAIDIKSASTVDVRNCHFKSSSLRLGQYFNDAEHYWHILAV